MIDQTSTESVEPQGSNSPSTQAQDKTSLPLNQYSAIEHLIAGYNLDETAKAVGVDPKTLYVWRLQPAFQAELTRCRIVAFDATRDKLVRLGGEAIDRMSDLISVADLRGLTQLMRTIGMLYKEPLSARTRDVQPTPENTR